MTNTWGCMINLLGHRDTSKVDVYRVRPLDGPADIPELTLNNECDDGSYPELPRKVMTWIFKRLDL